MLTGLNLRGAQTLLYHPSKQSRRWTLATTALFTLLFIYATALATLALTHMVPSAGLICQLESQWNLLFQSKNADVIRRIQDSHQCCGLRSVHDQAWPFPDREHTAAACARAFGRRDSCLRGWRRDEQITGGLILLVAGGVLVLKVGVIGAPSQKFFRAH